MSEFICNECGNPFSWNRKRKYCLDCAGIRYIDRDKQDWRYMSSVPKRVNISRKAIAPQKIIRMSPEQIIREWPKILAGAKNIKDFT